MGTDPATPLDTIEDLFAHGRDGGNWQGKGITSSAAATNGRRLNGLAVGATTETVVVKYTCNGDATLDGIINADD